VEDPEGFGREVRAIGREVHHMLHYGKAIYVPNASSSCERVIGLTPDWCRMVDCSINRMT